MIGYANTTTVPLFTWLCYSTFHCSIDMCHKIGSKTYHNLKEQPISTKHLQESKHYNIYICVNIFHFSLFSYRLSVYLEFSALVITVLNCENKLMQSDLSLQCLHTEIKCFSHCKVLVL